MEWIWCWITRIRMIYRRADCGRESMSEARRCQLPLENVIRN